jgi:transglutaminase-like putative cysteine protease
MSPRLRVEHDSLYRYRRPVLSSFNEARMTPLTTPSQLVLDSRLEVSPGARLQTYSDYWGTVVHAFDLHVPHDSLRVLSCASVETLPPPPAAAEGLSWGELVSDKLRDRFAEYLAPSTKVPADARLAQVAGDLRRSSRSPAEAVEQAVAWVKAELRYNHGSTSVHTSAVEAWEGGAGVCQDFAHLALALVRSMGIPGRYCSGYVHPKPEAPIGKPVKGEGHAWIEVWNGQWSAWDPTLGKRAGEHHVLVARGRDYSDVAPFKGIFHGGPTEALHVEVTLSQLA